MTDPITNSDTILKLDVDRDEVKTYYKSYYSQIKFGQVGVYSINTKFKFCGAGESDGKGALVGNIELFFNNDN